MSESTRRLGLMGLMLIVFSSMIGSGIFNIAQNMASGASAGATALSWGISAVGMMTLVLTFKRLADARPDRREGLYQYAQEGFGDYAGFNMAWGYWLCAAFGNIAYAVMLSDSLGAFFPALMDHSGGMPIFTSAMLWVMFFAIINGMRTATMLIYSVTALKFLSLAAIVVLLVAFFNIDRFEADFWGDGSIGPISEQVKSTMLVTLWCFLGIEGAMSMSGRAKKASDVGKAGVLGFLCAWLLYVVISLACYGLMSQPELAGLDNPSIAYVLRHACGDWAYYFVLISVIVALFGGWASWTLICSEVPYRAAEAGLFPAVFKKLNSNGMPVWSLFVSTIAMQGIIFLVMQTGSVYLTAIDIASTMVLPAYLFSGLFLLKATTNPQKYLGPSYANRLWGLRALGVMCTGYCLWMIYAAGLDMLMYASVFYVGGIFLFIWARRANYPRKQVFTKAEKLAAGVLVVCALAVAWLAMP
ncbi:MAG: basic amino acid/polyamine antiporter [Clostridium sp.]|nr:basic amino acid/polyamine antiporter [Clostridium sp.]